MRLNLLKYNKIVLIKNIIILNLLMFSISFIFGVSQVDADASLSLKLLIENFKLIMNIIIGVAFMINLLIGYMRKMTATRNNDLVKIKQAENQIKYAVYGLLLLGLFPLLIELQQSLSNWSFSSSGITD
ncbi:MAG: hypothetical protein HRU03_01610 [Nanoarchaeales archaeon]|nr:hypothetical protein [Nanoarchaeales archaeon]